VNHLGNIISTISDRKPCLPKQSEGLMMHEDLPNNPGVVHHYTAEILSVQEQYAYGMNMPGRSYNVSAYRYGWNKGSMKDDEITGVTGAHITTYFREYDTRIGRTWTPDPVFHPWQSPYTSMDNNPIAFNDPLGDWVKGAGFFKNIFNSDDKIKAEINSKALADATGGTVFKDGNGWTVNYTSGVLVNYGKGHFKLREFNVVHFKYKPGTLENFSNWFKNSTKSIGDNLAQEVGSEGSGIKNNWKTTFSLFFAWGFGLSSIVGEEFRNDELANSFRNAPGIVKARKEFYATGKRKTSGPVPFGLSGYWHSKNDPIESFVGSYDYQIFEMGNYLQFTITNRTSMSSFFPHPQEFYIWHPSMNPKNGMFSTFRQEYIFTEPILKD
jgi:hypothetical protein